MAETERFHCALRTAAVSVRPSGNASWSGCGFGGLITTNHTCCEVDARTLLGPPGRPGC